MSHDTKHKQSLTGKALVSKAIKYALGLKKSRTSRSLSRSSERNKSRDRSKSDTEIYEKKTLEPKQSRYVMADNEGEETPLSPRHDLMQSPFDHKKYKPLHDMSPEASGSDEQSHRLKLMAAEGVTIRKGDQRCPMTQSEYRLLLTDDNSDDQYLTMDEKTVIDTHKDTRRTHTSLRDDKKENETSDGFSSDSDRSLGARDYITKDVENQQQRIEMAKPSTSESGVPRRIMAHIASNSEVRVQKKPSPSRIELQNIQEILARQQAREAKMRRERQEYEEIMERSLRTLEKVKDIKRHHADLTPLEPQEGRYESQSKKDEFNRNDERQMDDDIYMAPIIKRKTKTPTGIKTSHRYTKQHELKEDNSSDEEYIPLAQPSKRTAQQTPRHEQMVHFTSTPYERELYTHDKHSGDKDRREKLVRPTRNPRAMEEDRQVEEQYRDTQALVQDRSVRPKQSRYPKNLQYEEFMEPPQEKPRNKNTRSTKSRDVHEKYPPLPGLSDGRERQLREEDDSPDLFSSDEESKPRGWIPDRERQHEWRRKMDRNEIKTDKKRHRVAHVSRRRKRQSDDSSDEEREYHQQLREWKKHKPKRNRKVEQRIVIQGIEGQSDTDMELDNASSSQTTTNIVTVSGKLPNIPKFSNSPQDSINFCQFLEDFEMHSSAMMIPKTSWGQILPLFLIDGARVIHRNLIEKHPSLTNNYTKLAEKLSAEMQSQGGQSSTAALYNRKKLATENIGKFYADISSIARRAFPHMENDARDSLILTSFISGLPMSYKRGLMNNQSIKTSEDAFRLASRFEQTNDILLNDEMNGEPSKTVNAIDSNQEANMEFIRQSLKNLELREGRQMNEDDRDARHRWREQNMKRPPLGGNARFYSPPRFKNKTVGNNFQTRGPPPNQQGWKGGQNGDWHGNNGSNRFNNNKWQNRNHHDNRNQRPSRQLAIGAHDNSNQNRHGREERFQHAQHYQQNHEGQEYTTDGRIICGYCQKVGHARAACRSRIRDIEQREASYQNRNKDVRMVTKDNTNSTPIVIQPESELESLQRLADQIEQDDRQSGLIKIIDDYAKQTSPGRLDKPAVLAVTSTSPTDTTESSVQDVGSPWRKKYAADRPVKYVECAGLEPAGRISMISGVRLAEVQENTGTRPRRRRRRPTRSEDTRDIESRNGQSDSRQASEQGIEGQSDRAEASVGNSRNEGEATETRQRQTRRATHRNCHQVASQNRIDQIKRIKHVDIRRLLIQFPGTPPRFDDCPDTTWIQGFRFLYEHNTLFKLRCDNWMRELIFGGHYDTDLSRNDMLTEVESDSTLYGGIENREARILSQLAEFKAVYDLDCQIERMSCSMGRQFHVAFKAHPWLLSISRKYLELSDRYHFESGDVEVAHRATCQLGILERATTEVQGYNRSAYPYLTEAMDTFPGTGPLFMDAPTIGQGYIYRHMYKKDICFRLCADQWTRLMVLVVDISMQYDQRSEEEQTVCNNDADSMGLDEIVIEEEDTRPPSYESHAFTDDVILEENVQEEDTEAPVVHQQMQEERYLGVLTARDVIERARIEDNNRDRRKNSGSIFRGWTKGYSLGTAIAIVTLLLLGTLPKVRSEATKPMLCNVGNHERNHLHLLLHLPTDVTCAKPKNYSQDITPLTLQLYKTSSLVLQEEANLCTKQTTTISTFLYFFTEERLVETTSKYEPTTYEECMEMIDHRKVHRETLTDTEGVISTHKSLEPVYVWCCHWEKTEIVNYILTKGYVYLHRDTGELQSTLADLSGCDFENFHCDIPDSGLIIWKGEISEECIFKESLVIPGQNHGSFWLSDDQEMALSFERSNWIARQPCPTTRKDLVLIHSDQGLYVRNLSEILNVKTTRFGTNLTFGDNISQISQLMIGELNSVATALSLQIQNLTKARFWDSMKALCNHEKVSMQLISKLMLLNPTLAVRHLLNDPYTISKPISGSDIAVYSCYPLESDQYIIGVDNRDKETMQCGDWIPVRLTYGIHADKQMFLNPIDNILHSDTPYKICKGNEQTYFRVNNTLMFYEWETNKVKQSVNQGSDMLKQLLFHNTSFNDTAFKAYKERISLLPIGDLNTGSDLLTDFVQTMQRERKQLRKIGIFPNSGKENTDSIPFRVSGLDLFGWIKSGMDRFFKIWSIVCNVVVTVIVVRQIIACGNWMYVQKTPRTSHPI